jgi:serine/threonine protein kinase
MTAMSTRPARSARRRERLGVVRIYEPLSAPGPDAEASAHLGWLVAARRLVVVRRLHPQHLGDEVTIARVRREVMLAMRVDHPNVVVTLGVALRRAELLVATEYVPGASLAEILASLAEAGDAGGLEPAVAIAITAGALRGLHAVQQSRASFSPRCFSPVRLIVGEDGRARVLDLDLAGGSLARPSAVVDELPYAAPEQLERRAVDARRDVYAASVVLWETLTGRSLFRGVTVAETLRKIRCEVVPAPSVFAPHIPPELDAVLLRGLARDREHRFPSVSAMLTALERAFVPAPPELVARSACALVLPRTMRRRALAESVRERERARLHIECNERASKQ